ncbi:hypothetical protein LguiB_026581 [Lonicera macranthoides]
MFTCSMTERKGTGANLSKYIPLFTAAVNGDWEKAKDFLKNEPDAVRAFITGASETALMIAARSSDRINFLKELLVKMDPPDLALTNFHGFSALHMAAGSGCTEVAKLLVNKNPSLPNIFDKYLSLPLHTAALFGKREMVLYLLSVTKEDTEPKRVPMKLQNVDNYANGKGVIKNSSYNVISVGSPEPIKFYMATPLSPDPESILPMIANPSQAKATSTILENCRNLRVAGAALQVQRELQWFKAVDEFTMIQDKIQRNSNGQTPFMVFNETHLELIAEGEKWIKEMSNSYTIVGALIVTIVFSAAITVPGGNNGSTGFPILKSNPAFVVFALSDALALFASTSSVLMFLSILTSRYGVEDFLYALPKRLIIGLATLFLSILFMMVAFGATLQIVIGDKASWILIPVVVLSCIPVVLFVSLQFPLLWDMYKFTYVGIFRKNGNRMFY